jgi:hypothetical protein
MQIALMVLFDTITSLEDPFDDSFVDTLSIMEALDHIAVVRAQPLRASRRLRPAPPLAHPHCPSGRPYLPFPPLHCR